MQAVGPSGRAASQMAEKEEEEEKNGRNVKASKVCTSIYINSLYSCTLDIYTTDIHPALDETLA